MLYIAAMWIAGVMQGLMWRAVNPDGTLVYSFVESVKATYPFYVVRLLGGLLYLGGMLRDGLERRDDGAQRPRRGRRRSRAVAGARLSENERNMAQRTQAHAVTSASRPATS